MTEGFIISFRETLEAALVVGIIFSWIRKTGQVHLIKSVWAGLGAGIAASIGAAFLFIRLAGGFEGRAEQIFEGVTMLIGGMLLVSMIVWMTKQKQEYKAKMEKKMERSAHAFGIFFLVFISVLREGVETVIFLAAANFASQNSGMGVITGIAAAILLGYAIFLGTIRFNFRHFFTVTSVALIVIAGNLFIHAVEELEEALIS